MNDTSMNCREDVYTLLRPIRLTYVGVVNLISTLHIPIKIINRHDVANRKVALLGKIVINPLNEKKIIKKSLGVDCSRVVTC